MELIVGQNCYTTVQEANQLINDRFPTSSKENQVWNALDENDKAITIFRFTELIDKPSTWFIGKKVDIEQVMEWPRITYKGLEECPTDIKLAIILQGIRDLRENESDNDDYRKMRDNGIKTYKIKDASVELFDKSDKESSIYHKDVETGIYTDIFNQYIKDYVIDI